MFSEEALQFEGFKIFKGQVEFFNDYFSDIFSAFSLSLARGGYSQKNWVGVCGPLPKSLTLFMTKICDFPYPIYDVTKNLIPYL